MKYDPVKKQLGVVFNRNPLLRKLFYKLLDLLLLRTWHVKKAIKQNFGIQNKEKLNILDAGMGFGQYSYFLAHCYPSWHIDGVDVKEEQVKDCSDFFQKIELYNVNFYEQDLIQLNEKEQYNIILSVDVMEHIQEDDLVFLNFYKAMKKNGMLLISTPSDQGGSDVHDHKDEHSFIDEHVRDGYNIMTIQKQLKKAGFSKTDAYYSYGCPGHIAWKLSMKFPIMLLNSSRLFFIILPIYYLITFPFCLLLNWLDVSGKHQKGTGLIVKAWK